MKTRLFLWPVALLPLLATQVPAGDIWPAPNWPTAKPEEVGLDAARLAQAREYALSGGGAGYITRGGRLAMSWGDAKRWFDLKSTTKSIGVTALGLAIGDGKLELSDLARERHSNFGIPPGSPSDARRSRKTHQACPAGHGRLPPGRGVLARHKA